MGPILEVVSNGAVWGLYVGFQIRDPRTICFGLDEVIRLFQFRYTRVLRVLCSQPRSS